MGDGSSLHAVNFTGYTASIGREDHLCITADGSNCRLYYNGSLVSTITQPAAFPGTSGTGHFTIARSGDFNGNWFQGMIDEVYYYENKVLTLSEVNNIMNYH